MALTVSRKFSGLPKNQVIGSGTFLDSQRLRNYLGNELSIAESSIHAYLLGEHGDSQVYCLLNPIVCCLVKRNSRKHETKHDDP